MVKNIKITRIIYAKKYRVIVLYTDGTTKYSYVDTLKDCAKVLEDIEENNNG